MKPEPKKWTLSGLLPNPKRLVGRGVAATGILIGGTIASPAYAAPDNPPKLVKDDADQQKTMALVSQIKAIIADGDKKPKVSREVIDRYIEQLADDSYRKREEASNALIRFGYQTEPALRIAIKTTASPERRNRAQRILEAFGLVEEQMAVKLSPLFEQLGNMGEKAQVAIPDLLAVLELRNQDIRRMVVIALDHMKAQDEAVVTALINILRNAGSNIAEIEIPTVSPWTRQLVMITIDGKMSTKQAIIIALGKMGPKAAPAVDLLIGTLDDNNKKTRLYSAITLGQIGPGAKAAVPALANALSDQWDAQIRMQAAVALGEIGPAAAKEAVPALAARLGAGETYYVAIVEAIKALGRMGPGTKEALPDIISTFRNGNLEVKNEAIATLVKLAQEDPAIAKALTPALIENLKDDDSLVVRATIETLAGMGEKAKPAIGDLKTLRDSRTDREKLWAPQMTKEIKQRAGDAMIVIEGKKESRGR